MQFLTSCILIALGVNLASALPTSNRLTKRACYITRDGVQHCTAGAGGIIITSNNKVKRQCFIDLNGEQHCTDSPTTVVTSDGTGGSAVATGKKAKRQCFIDHEGNQVCFASHNTVVTTDGTVAQTPAETAKTSDAIVNAIEAATSEAPVANVQVAG